MPATTAVRRHAEDPRSCPDAAGHGRSPVAYALLPRPQELVLKPLLLIVSYAAGRWASPGNGPAVLAVLGLGVVVEAFVYQARYVVNDLLDARLDAEHPASRARRRLPPGPTARRWAAVSIVARLTAAALVTAATPSPVRAVCVLAALAVLAAAVPYETVRQRMRRPAPMVTVTRVTPAVAGAYILVGTGFVIRIGAGLAVAGAPLPVLVAAALFAAPFGILYTTMAWALQATSFVAPDWSTLDRRVSHKRQLGPLLRWAGLHPLPHSAPSARPVDTRVLAPPCAAGAVWMWAGLAGAASAAALGTALSVRFLWGAVPPWTAAAIGAVCIVGAWATLRGSQVESAARAVALTAATVGAVVATAAAGRAELPLLTGLPIGGMLATAVVMRSLTYSRVIAFAAPSPAVPSGEEGTTTRRAR